MALYIPFLSTDRLRKRASLTMSGTSVSSSSDSGRAPLATITPHGQTLRIVLANQIACEMCIRPGQTLAEAKAIVPDLITCDDDPVADRRQLESLALWADRLAPTIHIEGDDTLIADITGCQRLFSGEPNLLSRAVEGLSGEGFAVRAAIADTPGAAWALAHAHPDPTVIANPGQTAAFLAPLPVWALRIDPRTRTALASVGVETIASLLYLPRSSLASRFGQAALDRVDQALGHLPEVLKPYRPAPVLTSRFRLGSATTRINVLAEAMHRALVPFCQKLEKRVAGVRQMFVTFYCADLVTEEGTATLTVTLPVDLSRPTRCVDHLRRLLVVLLDKLHLPGPADSLMLWARELDSLDGWQDELFATESADAHELADLLDRLSARLGSGAVVRPETLSEHQPERAFRYVPVTGGGKHDKSQTASDDKSCPSTAVSVSRRPLCLAPRPLEIAATALVPEGPPIAFQLHGTRHTVADSVGPERIETGWWRGPHIKRDYYRVLTEAGRRCWLFRSRDTGQWFLHGWFD